MCVCVCDTVVARTCVLVLSVERADTVIINVVCWTHRDDYIQMEWKLMFKAHEVARVKF